MEPIVARKTWRTVEPLHSIVYFAKEQGEVYGALGLPPAAQYFASRAAPMGAVTTDVVIATFFNFRPDFVRSAFSDDVWETASPAAVVDARLEVADRALRRILGDALDAPEVADAADLARRAAEEAATRIEGRPLFAGHAAQAWPDGPPHLVLWHAQTLLREFRGDGHIAALVTHGVDGCEALVLHAATGEAPREFLQPSRRWSDVEWDAAADRLRSRGWVDDAGGLTDTGRSAREAIEAMTDDLAVAAYAPLGDDGCERLRTLTRPLSKAMVASGELFSNLPQ